MKKLSKAEILIGAYPRLIQGKNLLSVCRVDSDYQMSYEYYDPITFELVEIDKSELLATLFDCHLKHSNLYVKISGPNLTQDG